MIVSIFELNYIFGMTNLDLAERYSALEVQILKKICISDTVEKFSAPIPSPTMAGGLFAINRKYFQHIGKKFLRKNSNHKNFNF